MKDLFKNLKYTYNYIKNQKKDFAVYIFVEILSVICSLLLPILSAKIIINLSLGNFKEIIEFALIIFVIQMLYNVIHFFESKSMQKIFRETLYKMQKDVSNEILRLDNETLDKNGSGVFIQRMTNDTSRISDFINDLISLMSGFVARIGIFGAIFIINKKAFVFSLFYVIVLYLVDDIRTKKYIEKDKVFRKEKEKISSFIGEIVRGARDIKMLNAEESFKEELNKKVYKYNQKAYEMSIPTRIYNFIGGTIRDIFDLSLIVMLVILIKENEITIASALVINNYVTRIGDISYYLGRLLESSKDFNLSASRIYSLLEGNEFTKEKFGNKHIDKVNGTFEFKNVNFKYDKNYVLKNMSFKIKENETVAFVGKSGVGKSTVFSLLCKMYEANSGKILIDNININELDKDSIRGNMTIISQNPYIFNLSIKDNLKLVKSNVTDKEIKKACKIACLDDFIMTLPKKYNTIVGEGGVTLSGGQKQRLAIARALLQETEIILFDEATSALDNETQKQIQEAINNMKGTYTILIIAHRLSTIINSDKILVMDDGKIVAEGKHNELLKKCKAYKELYNSEIKK